ncbi:hypothetical protein LCGC14_1449480 [marine sediment metagenome]|uniref:C2H2-type domain-containing protein n=1 Tax=marine sediment metagenome TaxID=412755 RepID=A0A0F9JI76_9ZZZZ
MKTLWTYDLDLVTSLIFGRKGNNQHYKENHPEIWAQWQNNLQKASLEYVRSEKARNNLSKRAKKGEMVCHICGEIVYGTSELKRHYAEVHNDPVPCPFCRKAFKGKGGLSTHIRFCPENPDHEIRKIEHFPCPFCDEIFGSQRSLSGHITRGHKIINHRIIDIKISECEPVAIYNF